MKNCLKFILFSSLAYSQQKVFVQNGQTKEPILYANVWKENNLYSTTDSLGYFYSNQNKIIEYKITAIGYFDKIAKSNDINIVLEPKEIKLEEVKIFNPTFKHVQKIGKATKKGNTMGVNFNAEKALVVKFIPNNSGTDMELFINSVSFYTSTNAKNRKANLIFYSVGESGQPEELINDENIICNFKRGNTLNKVDLKKSKISLPKNGIFVGVQHLLIDSNKFYPDKNSNNIYAFCYEPFLYITENPDFFDSWYFENGNWISSNKYSINLEIEISD